MDEKELKEKIRQLIVEKLEKYKETELTEEKNSSPKYEINQRVITASDFENIEDYSYISIKSDAIITPLAREIIKTKKLNVIFSDIKKDKIKIAIGSDHAGYKLKEELKTFLKLKGIEFFDFGTDGEERVDFNEYAYKVAKEVSDGNFDYGIIIDGLGIASSIVANKLSGIRAAPCTDAKSAKISREHIWSNVLTLGSMILTVEKMREIVDTWLNTPYGKGRYERRVKKILELEKKLREI